MAGFKILDQKGDGLVIYKPNGKYRYVIALKTQDRIKDIGYFYDNTYTDELKDKLAMLGAIKI